MSVLFDSHAHLTSLAEEELGAVLDRARFAHVEHIVNIATDRLELEKGLKLAEDHFWIVNAAATTPHDVEKQGESDFAFIENKAREGKLVAIGETGLDYHYTYSPKELQQHFLIRYLQLATSCSLPVIFHCREAFDDLFSIVKKHYQGRALVHCFTGTKQEAKKAVEMGWYLSISGIVTFKKSVELQQVVKHIPLESLLIETDTPYLAPQSKRGKKNEPSFIVETAHFVADLKGISFESVVAATSHNAKTFFGIS